MGGERLLFREHADHRHAHESWAHAARQGTWEAAVLERFSHTVERGDVVLDLGAHEGVYALLASRLVGPNGRVFAFEPDPVARDLLEANVERNSASNVTVVPMAVSDAPGTVWLRSEQLGNRLTMISRQHGELAVAAVTLSSFCRERDIVPAVIKIDVEGSEVEVLADDAIELVRRARATFVEIHEKAIRERGIEPSQFLDRLTGWGLELQELDRRSSSQYHLVLVPR